MDTFERSVSMLVLKRLLAIATAGIFAACAVEPTAERTTAQKVAFEEDENVHLPGDKEKSEDATSSKSRVRVNKNPNAESMADANKQPETDEKDEQKEVTPPPVEEMEEEMEEEELAEEEEEQVPAGPLVSLQAPAAPQNYTLLSQNTITVPVTAAAAGTAVFTVDRSALDLVDLAGDITIAPALPTLTFAAAGETKMLTINVTITGKNPATGAQTFTLVATPTGQEPIQLPINFSVEPRIDIEVTNIGNNTTFTAGGQALNAGDNIDVKDGTMITFINKDPNANIRVHMAGGYHQGAATALDETFVPSADFCGDDDRANQVFYDHNNQSGNDARMITCVDRQ